MPIARHGSFLQLRAEVREHAVPRGELTVKMMQLVAGVFEEQQPTQAVAEREQIDEDDQEEETNLNAVFAKQLALEGHQKRGLATDPEHGEQNQERRQERAVGNHG